MSIAFVSVTDAPYNADPTGATDSAPAFQSAVNAFAGTGVAMLIPSGTFKIASTVTLKSNLTIIGTSKTIIKSTLTSGGGSTDATFLAIWSASGVNTTLSATPKLGANAVVCTSVTGYNVNDTISIGEAAHGYQQLFYTITAINGGTKTLTLDRPIRLPFASGDTVVGISNVPTEIHIQGNDMLFTGTSERYCEFAGTLRCSINNVRADTSLGAATNDYWFSFDVGGRNNFFRNVRCDIAQTTPTVGIVLESNENSIIEDCIVTGGGQYNYLLLDCVGCELRNCVGTGCVGPSVAFNGEDGILGCVDCRVIGGSHLNNASYGVLFTAGAIHCVADGVAANFNQSMGILLDGTGSDMRGNSVVNCSTEANLLYGVKVASGARDTIVENLRSQNNGANGIYALDDVLINGLVSYNTFVPTGAALTSQQTLATGGSATVRLKNARITSTQSSTNFDINVGSGSMMYLDDVADYTSTNNYGVVVYGTAYLRDVLVTPYSGSTATNGLYLQTTGTARVFAGCDFTGTTSPVTVAGSGVVSMAQDNGNYVGTRTTAGTTTLSQTAAASSNIRSTVTITGNVRYDVPAAIPGLRYTIENLTTGAFTFTVGVTGGTGIVVATGKRATVQSDGTNMQRVTADT